MESTFVHLTEKEVELLDRWQAEGKSVRETAGLLERGEAAIHRLIKSAMEVSPPPTSLAGNRAEGATAMELVTRGPCGPSVDRPVDRSVDRCIFIGFSRGPLILKRKLNIFNFLK